MPVQYHIVLHETGEFWPGYVEAAKDLGVDICNLRSHISGKRLLRKLSGLTLYRVCVPLCVKCDTVLTEDNWSKADRENHCYICRSCSSKRSLGYYYANKDRAKLKYRYGISREQYNNLVKKQNGRCAICKCSSEELGRPLFVDHDHETKKVRGLLCQKCNMGLGYFNDNKEVLLAANNYLERMC